MANPPSIPVPWKKLVETGMAAWAKTNTPCETWLDLPIMIRVQLMPIPGQTAERAPLVARCTAGMFQELNMHVLDTAPLIIPWGAGIRVIEDRNIEHTTVSPILPEAKEYSNGH